MNWDFDNNKTRIKLTPASQAEGDLLKRIVAEGYDEVNITLQLNHQQQIVALFLWKKTKPEIVIGSKYAKVHRLQKNRKIR